jgi:hypothetical protein
MTPIAEMRQVVADVDDRAITPAAGVPTWAQFDVLLRGMAAHHVYRRKQGEQPYSAKSIT